MPPNSWKGEEEEYFHTSGPNSHPLAKNVNLYLQRKLLRAKNIILNAQIEEQQITFEEFKNELTFWGKSMRLQDLAEQYIEKRIGEGAKKTTLVLYNTKKNKLKGTIQTLIFMT